jgi:two-component system, OmpR family, heavy metal sensor histidine kinase CusS
MGRSLLRDLRLGFALATLVLAGLLAFFMDLALRRSLETVDAQVLRAQSQAVLELLARRQVSPDEETLSRPGRAEWRLIETNDHVQLASEGIADLGPIPWPDSAPEPQEVRSVSGRAYFVMVIPLGDRRLQLALDRGPQETVLSQFRRALTIGLIAATILAALLGTAIAHRGLRPLQEIARETAIIDPKQLSRRLDSTRFPEELAEIVTTLNITLERLEDAFGRLEHLGTDLAHELRSPVQNLRSEVEGLLLRKHPPEEQQELFGSLLEELDRLGAMIEQMLFLARASAPNAAIRRERLSARAALEEVADFFASTAEDKDISLPLQADPSLTLEADPQLLQRALHNLVANALRHTPSGGFVRLRGSRAVDNHVELSISDSGEGIPAELLPRLGERFARAESSRERSKGGTGLGLAIVKGIMRLHHGELVFESEMGRGTRATLRFPDGRA